MRPIRLTSLVILALLAGSACARRGRTLAQESAALLLPSAGPQLFDDQARKAEMLVSWPVEGWGNTREDAWQRALENARSELPVHLARCDLALDWRPSISFIKDKLVKGAPEYLQPEDFHEPVGECRGFVCRLESQQETGS